MDGRSFRPLNVPGNTNREGHVVEMDASLPTERVVRASNQDIGGRGKLSALRVGTGPDYISGRVQAWAEKAGVALRYTPLGTSQQTACAERDTQTVRTEWLGRGHFETNEEVRERAMR